MTEDSRSPEPSASSKQPPSGGLSASKTSSTPKRMGFWVNPKLLDARLALFREGQHEPETAAGQEQGGQQPEEKEPNRDRGHEQ